jgi:hypothetical protein
MLCSLTKRLISRREDSARPLPAWGEGHLRRCPKCREFDEFCASIGAKAKADLDLRSPADAARDARILSALKAKVSRRAGLFRPPRPVPAGASSPSWPRSPSGSARPEANPSPVWVR